MSKQTFPSGVQIAGDLGGTPSSPQVTGAHFGGSDGQYFIRRSGVWAPNTPSYLDLSNVPASFTPSAHASTHMPDGADSVLQITRNGSVPAANGYLVWAFDPADAGSAKAPTAGVVHLAKFLTHYAFTVNTVDIWLNTAGTGATSLANCFIGIYDSGGTRRFVSSDQSTVWNSGGGSAKSVTVSGGYQVAANDYIYVAVLIGTQSTTAASFNAKSVTQATTAMNLSAAAYRTATQLSGQTSLPSTLTLSSNATTNTILLIGIR